MARILLVDDDRDIRELSRALLATAGHEVSTADGVLPALQILQNNQFDLLISDVNMPGHTGFDLVRTLRRDPRFANLTIAMLTGRRERRDIEKALELGVHDYIVKPLDPLLFLQKVKDLIDRHKPAEHTEIEFASATLSIQAKATVAIEIRSISEVGFVIRSANPFKDGTRIEFATDLFQKIGVEPPMMKVLSSVENGDSYETRVNFIGADEKTLSKIRAWVHASVRKQGRSAA